ncbi:3-phosphoshikimate 1-carboxyvinyltransferase [Texcoconibacillus texcoconensis]|uniref:3-phosphoshikimate 1-carboxyvinyltransferase n=1 Tax=Texcoconibacillus texcoconensis TaxID=1095777 RepID=A0A840QNE6_9BACI|nr:3-phosphoshikimate 1-carboxyvinyltransferase [Texcoconibacillus texcoconensis]MBB5172878.1 3-phosphoshikimate 1-carboxyvinyltransferase [Texcoconibacillus texcoconensis]
MTERRMEATVKSLNGRIAVPGDKSISHRSIMLGALAEGRTTVEGFLFGEDCKRTVKCFQELGVSIEQTEQGALIIEGVGYDGLKEPTEVLDVGNSGTTIRLMLGILASRPFHSVLTGDASIRKRPMDRVTVPLKQMGAVINGREQGRFAPLAVSGENTSGIVYDTPVASAQVKSAVLLAGLGADGETVVREPAPSRDHTERMLQAFGVNLEQNGTSVRLKGKQKLSACDIRVPGDISSAAFFLAGTAITEASEVYIENVGVNPTRTGILDVMKKMGANVVKKHERIDTGEPIADLEVRSSALTATTVEGDDIPRLIDEIPVLAVLATQAEGTTVIKDAAELKVKETNRIDTVVGQLKKLGANIEATEDGMVIHGRTPLKGGTVDSFGDHRIGMAMAIASLVSEEPIVILNQEAVDVSYPGFFEDLSNLSVTTG